MNQSYLLSNIACHYQARDIDESTSFTLDMYPSKDAIQDQREVRKARMENTS